MEVSEASHDWSRENAAKSSFKQIVSWAIGAVLACGSILLGFLRENIGWPSYVGLSIVVGLSSNGIYDIEAIKNFIDSWFNKKKA